METEAEKIAPPMHDQPDLRPADVLRSSDSIGNNQLRNDRKHIDRDAYQVDGAFDGSFGGISHPQRVVHWYFKKDYFTKGWDDPSIWRATVVELFVTAFLVYTSGQFGISLLSSNVKFVMGYVGIFNSVFLAVFIYAAIPGSGGHLNPLITFSTFLCGLCPASRGMTVFAAHPLMYMAADVLTPVSNSLPLRPNSRGRSCWGPTVGVLGKRSRGHVSHSLPLLYAHSN